MKQLITLTLALCFLYGFVQGQKYVEVGGFIGFAGYQGDLTEDPIDFRETKYSFGGFATYHYNRKMNLRGQVYYGRISGADANSTSKGLRNRDWSFNADLIEASISAEWMPFAKARFDKVGLFRPQINPYFTLGVGLTFADKEIVWKHSTEMPEFGFPEPLDQNNFFVIPVGAGLRLDFTQWTTIAGEFGFRYTQSDYVDGISQNAKAAGPDWYFFIGVTASTYFGQQEDFGLN